MRRLRNKMQSGYTLIEIMMATVILGLVLMISFGFWNYVSESYSFAWGKSRSMTDVYRVTSKIVRELREVGYGEEGSHPLQVTNDQELSFFADEDEDGQTERVRYWLEGQRLMRGVVEPETGYDTGLEVAKAVIEGVENGSEPLFYYYNSDWPADQVNNPLISDRQLATRMITVKLWLRSEDDQTASASAISSSVLLRRL